MGNTNYFIFDRLTVHIIMSIATSAFEHKETTTWEIAKCYKWEDFSKDQNYSRFYTTKCNIVKKRLDLMAKEGIVRIDKESKENVYTLDVDKIKIENKRLPCGIKKCLLIQEKTGKWHIVEI